MLKFKISKEKSKIVISVNPRLYPLGAIYGAAYVFLDRAYLFLDGNPKSQVIVSLKGKQKLTTEQLKGLAGEFYNELLNCALRDKISQNNQKIREFIIARALFSAQGFPEEKIKKGPEKPKKEEWQKDTLGIALPWEEKYKKK